MAIEIHTFETEPSREFIIENFGYAEKLILAKTKDGFWELLVKKAPGEKNDMD